MRSSGTHCWTRRGSRPSRRASSSRISMKLVVSGLRVLSAATRGNVTTS